MTYNDTIFLYKFQYKKVEQSICKKQLIQRNHVQRSKISSCFEYQLSRQIIQVVINQFHIHVKTHPSPYTYSP